MAEFILSAFADEADKSLDGQIRALLSNGIYLLEPRNIGGAILSKTPDELKSIRGALDENGIGISALGSPIGKSDITADFEGCLSDFRKAIDACRILGTERMRIFSFFVSDGEYGTYRTEVLRRMNILLNIASDAGIKLCHENECNIYGQNPAQVRDLLSSLPGLCGIFDAANYIMSGNDALEGFEATWPSLEYIHVKDASAAEKCIQPAGFGDGHYEEILRRVDEGSDRTFILTLEPHLHVFDTYKSIDSHSELKTGMSFRSQDEAFAYAAGALKNMLGKLGFSEKENHIWKK